MTENTENIIITSITDEAKKSYLDYAMSVIVSRALPSVYDGLKPVQRRVIYAMHEQGIVHSSRFQKCAAVVGEVLKKYHPHGDTSVYDALVRMGQDFSLRYLLIDPQGNFGSIDGDGAAAMRYTECRLAKISDEILCDIDKDTVTFNPNYSGQYQEPETLPSKIPNLLLNGALGIAVGMATNIPPHNLAELIDGLVFMVDNVEGNVLPTIPSDRTMSLSGNGFTPYNNFESKATVEDLYKFIKGPDFPTGATIYDKSEVLRYFATGKGRILTRAKASIEEGKNGKVTIAVTEIPYLVNKSTLIEQIANLVRDKKIDGISDLRDESDRDGIRIAIELKRDTRPQRILNNLYKHSEMQRAFNVNLVALVGKEPKLLTLKMVLEEFIRHRQKVVFRRTAYLLKKAKEREHILQGLKIALDHIEEVIKVIRESSDAEKAKVTLMARFKLSEIQAVAILDMQLRKLAALERKKIEDELQDILKKISEYLELLGSTKKGLEIIKTELLEIKQKYSDGRKTKVVMGKIGEFSDEELIKKEEVAVTLSSSGYIKRQSLDAYKKQSRGGKGIKGTGLKDEDYVYDIKTGSTHDEMFFFTNKGKVYRQKVWEIPETSRQARGTPAVNLLDLASDEQITEFISVSSTDLESETKFVMMATAKGTIKKTALAEFGNIRSSGIRAINLDEDDTLGWAKVTSGKDKIMLISKKGKCIKFEEKEIRQMGRQAGGIRGIKLHQGDELVAMEVISATFEPSANMATPNLLIITKNGYGKKTPISEYPIQKRGGSGVKTAKINAKNGDIVNAKILNENTKDVIVISREGQLIRVTQKDMAKQSRSTQGVIVMRLNKGDTVSGVATVEKGEEQ